MFRFANRAYFINVLFVAAGFGVRLTRSLIFELYVGMSRIKMQRRTQQTFSLDSDVVEAFHRTIQDGYRSMALDVILTKWLTDVNLKAFKEAKTEDKRAAAMFNINILKKAALSITESLKNVDTHKQRMRRLILKEANFQ